jgi:peptidoglycan/xylan/chitin deacetylase (PgdA/CDA1 family)
MRPIAYVSVDLDTVDTHLAGYGVVREPCDRIYRTAVPRLLDLFDRVGVRATLFVVARDADSEAPLWREALRRGHEIASHSLTHPLPFTSLSGESLRREVEESRARLEGAIGRPVLGFRAPGWYVDDATLAAVAGAGYRYDASVFPSPVLGLHAFVRKILARGAVRDASVWPALRRSFASRRPHRTGPDGRLAEFPVAVSPVLRIPLLHTLWYGAPAVARRTLDTLCRARAPLSYQFHAADALGLAEDGVDPRLARHPGMRLPLDRKMTLLEGVLARIAATYDVSTYAAATAHDDAPSLAEVG